MFTVIIAEKSTLELFSEFDIFLEPLLDKNKVAFCEWNREGKTIEEMLPDIYGTIEFQSEWRAVIVNSDGLYRVNPFDYVQYSEPDSPSFGDMGWEFFDERRKRRFACYNSAIQNPLTRLTTALSGAPVFNSTVGDDETFRKIVSEQMPLYEYMLSLQLSALDLSLTAAYLTKYQTGRLSRFVSEDKIDQLIDHIRRGESGEIISMISSEKVIDLIKLIGENDPFYSDPEYIDRMVENTYKSGLYGAISYDFTFRDRLPSEVICVAPRTFDSENYDQQINWKKNNDESRYSRFTEWNLYPEINKYFVFDIIDKDNKQYLFDQIRMLCFLLILAVNTTPQGVIASKRLYRANVNFDNDALERSCAAYLAKLRATDIHLQEITSELQKYMQEPLDNITVREVFESDVKVSIDAAEYSRDDLFAEFHKLGLSTDCPRDEKKYWDDQYRTIERRFVRYLREPRRALKNAVKDGLHANDRIDDERALQLNENQLEDIQYRLFEEEENMVKTSTVHLYNTAEFKKNLSDADREIKRKIAQRMTRKKTFITALIALLAYFLGFIPLMISNVNTVGSFLFSTAVSGIALGAFCLVGFIFLFVMRRRLINRFKHFNYVMSGICTQIEDGLRGFAKYLGHACNVMREFSVLETKDSPESKKLRILSYHKITLNNRIKNASMLFSKYIDCRAVDLKDADPYDYDFTLLREYKYEMPYTVFKKKIEYMQPGNEIIVPMDFVKSVDIIREELYD